MVACYEVIVVAFPCFLFPFSTDAKIFLFFRLGVDGELFTGNYFLFLVAESRVLQVKVVQALLDAMVAVPILDERADVVTRSLCSSPQA